MEKVSLETNKARNRSNQIDLVYVNLSEMLFFLLSILFFSYLIFVLLICFPFFNVILLLIFNFVRFQVSKISAIIIHRDDKCETLRRQRGVYNLLLDFGYFFVVQLLMCCCVFFGFLNMLILFLFYLYVHLVGVSTLRLIQTHFLFWFLHYFFKVS